MPESALEKIVRLSGKPPWLDKGAGKEDEVKEKSPADMTDDELKAAYKKMSTAKKMPWMKDKEESSELKAVTAEMKKRKISY